MPDYLTESTAKYLDDLASDLPAPGGGSAAAFSGALGMSLLCMVANFTRGREKYRSVEDDILIMLSELEQLKKNISALIQHDVEAYSVVSKAYKLPSVSETEKKERSAAIQHACKEALMVPMEIIENCVRAMGLAEKLLKTGNPNLISDVGAGTVLLEAAIRSAEINVRINLKSIKDPGFIETKNARVKELTHGISEQKDRIVNNMGF